MNHHVVQMLRPRPAFRPVPNGKKFNGKFGRLGKWLFNKLEEDDWTEKEFIEYETVSLTPDRLLEEISKQQHAIRMIYGNECESIVIGRQFFNDAIYYPPVTLHMDFRLGGPEGVKIFGIPVRFVPWFEGVLVLPKQK